MKNAKNLRIIFITFYLLSTIAGPVCASNTADAAYSAVSSVPASQAQDNVSGEAIKDQQAGVYPSNEEIREKADRAVERHERKSLKQRWIDRKINAYLIRSRKYFSKNDYGNARKFAYKVLELAPDNSEAAALISEITKEEMFGNRIKEEGIIKRKEERASDNGKKQIDPLYRYNENNAAWGALYNMFSDRVYKPVPIPRKERYTIQECVNTALSRSQRIVVADKQIRLAEMKLWEARRGLFPEVKAKYELSSGKISSGGYNRHYRGTKYSIETKQTVFNGFEDWYNVRQAQVNYEAVLLEKDKIRNEVIQKTKEAYYNLDKAEKSLEIQQAHKKRINDLLQVVEKSYNEQIVPKIEYLKVKGQNMQADFQYISSKSDVDLAHMMLFQAMNMEPDPDVGIVPMEEPSSTLSIGLENCYKLAYANRPDLKIKEKMIEHNDLERKKKRARGWPKIDFQGSFGAAYENFEPLFLPDDTQADEAGNPTREGRGMEPEWFAGVTGSIPIWGNTLEYNYVREEWAPTVSSFRGSSTATSYFSLGLFDDLRYFTDVRDSRVGFESAKLDYMDLKKDVAVNVKEAYFKYRKAVLQMEVSKAQLEHQKLYMKILEERRKFGEMEVSRVIEEYEKLTEYQFGLVQGEADYFIALADLNKAIGVSDYFIPKQESRVYQQWKDAHRKKQEEKTAAGIKKKNSGFFGKLRIKRAENYIRISEKYVKDNKFKKARRYALKAGKILGDKDQRVIDVLKAIDDGKNAASNTSAKKDKSDMAQSERDNASLSKDKQEVALVKQHEISKKYLEKAEKYLNEGKYTLSRKYVYKALSAQPSNAEAKALLEILQQKAGK